MCYTGFCPGENWEGACVRPNLQNTPAAHCYDGPEREDEEDE